MNEDWKAKIKKKVSQRVARQQEIHSGLHDLLTELTAAPYNLRVKLSLVEEGPLAWEVSIAHKQFIITENDVSERQRVYDDTPRREILPEKRDLKEALINILSHKF